MNGPTVWLACATLALILRDTESFHEAAMALEYVGQILSGEIRTGLAKYEPELLELAKTAERHESSETTRLFKVVREARNMAVHEGAWTRHLSSRLIDLFLILEEAIMTKMTCAEDIMVRNPVVAEPWQMVAHIRKTMLANSFSHVPIFLNGEWLIVSDLVLMRFLHGATNAKEKLSRLSMQIGAVIDSGEIARVRAVCFELQTTLDQLVAGMQDLPVLVTQDIGGTSRLLGIVTPFDLL